MAKTLTIYEALFDSHEDRLQRLEQERLAVNVEVANCRSDIGHLSEQVSEGFRDMRELMAAHMKQTDEAMAQMLSRLTPLEEEKKTRDVKRGLVKRWALPAVMAGIGAFFAKFGAAIYEWFNKLGG